jgi:hypothetical protein
MADIAVLTAQYGHYDEIRAQACQDVDVDWIYVTDTDVRAPGHWNVIRQAARFDHPCLAAKVPKMLPWTVAPHRHVIWIDANMQITSPAFVREVLALPHSELAVWQHPRRDCIYTEAQASIGVESQGGKYDDQPILEQVDHYRAEGHPEHGGLYACGTIAWDTDSELARDLGAAWLAECERWSIQDQLSLPVVCRRLGLVPSVFGVRQIERYRRRAYLENRWLRIHPHL